MYGNEGRDEFPIDVEAIFMHDNTVLPVAFWTRDYEESITNERISIDRVIDRQNAATFKQKGVGDRYKVEARGVTSFLFRIGDFWYNGHTSDDMRIPGIHTRYEGAYYGGKRIIDERYDNPYKVQVEVRVVFMSGGYVKPLGFWWSDGVFYEIDRVADSQRSSSIRAGIIGLCYTIRVRGRETLLYRDDDLWFMENRRNLVNVRVLDVHGRVVKQPF